MRLTLRVTAILAIFLLAVVPLSARKGESDKIVVQHILIGFKKSVPNQTLERDKRTARTLAEQLLERALAGEDFDALVKEYTNDKYPGILLLTNKDAPRIAGGTMRSQVVAKFGDLSFRLEVDEIGIAAYHAASSPYGWHVIKRLE